MDLDLTSSLVIFKCAVSIVVEKDRNLADKD